MDAALFQTWFTQVHGFPPFPWQTRLANLLLDGGEWPSVIDLPTGSGKTATIDIALFALAARPDVAPRRIVYVVDRRVIVSQTAVHMRALTDAVSDPDGHARRVGVDADALRVVSDSLAHLSADDGGPRLAAAELRGGIVMDETWGARPDTPAILVSTVDQVGSRLLFRGYGLTRGRRPIQAGLLGKDALFILDEVHLSRPFAEVLERVGEMGASHSSVPRRLQVTHLSATPGGLSTAKFTLDPGTDLAEGSVLQRRVEVQKSVTLHKVGTAHQSPEEALVSSIPPLAVGMNGDTVGVIVNRVATARQIAETLRTRQDAPRVELLTGRMRPLDRDRRWEAIKDRVAAGRNRHGSTNGQKLFLVATQTIEAGADLDLDGMVTEIAPLDALRQRWGRVDRRGDLFASATPASIVVVAAMAQTKAGFDDAVYGDRLTECWQLLNNRFGDTTFDGGPVSTDLASIDSESTVQASAATPSGPLLLEHHWRLLWQTDPAPPGSPDVKYFLHGRQESQPEINIVWRADLGPRHLRMDPTGRSAARSLLQASPPRSEEALAVPLVAARRWLRGLDESGVADVEGAGVDQPEEERSQQPDGAVRRTVVKWDGTNTEPVVVVGPTAQTNGEDVARLSPGDTIVVPAAWGGLSDGVWSPTSSTPVTDLGDVAEYRCVREERSREYRIRLHPDVLSAHGVDVADVPTPPSDDDEVEVTPFLERVLDWVADNIADAEGVDDTLRQVALALIGQRNTASCQVVDVHDTSLLADPAYQPKLSSGYVIVRSRVDRRKAVFETDDSDTTHSFTGQRVTLDEHSEGVARRAAAYARACTADNIATDLELAGRLHDLGKSDPRFQSWLLDGDPVEVAKEQKLLAKSGTDFRYRATSQAARCRARLPTNFSHELLSVALIISDPSILQDAEDPDLVLHLVATHHGRCRIIPPVQTDPDPRTVTTNVRGHRLVARTDHDLDAVDSPVLARHEMLLDRYGWHGLAWMEAILRLADQQQSEWEQRQRNTEKGQ